MWQPIAIALPFALTACEEVSNEIGWRVEVVRDVQGREVVVTWRNGELHSIDYRGG